jgi:hypothetical protein
MGSNRPAARGPVPFVASFLTALALTACAARPPRLVPPAGGVEAVEGFGSASIAGAEASVKGKFGFVFRKAGFGRVEAVDPIGRTAFLIIFREGRAWFVLPGRKAYAEDAAGLMMERFLGVALEPDEAALLLSGTWKAGASPGPGRGEDAWVLDRDAEGRVVRGAHGELSFAVKSFFPGDGVPREIALLGVGASGRVKVLRIAFDPAPRDAAFDVAFLTRYAKKTWDELLELFER